MKKLLFIGALMLMGATAYGVNPTAGEEATAEVTVRAEIVDDFFSITDIYGNPLILDFKEVPQKLNALKKANVRYKVTAKEAAADTPIKLNMTLAEKGYTDGGVVVPIYHNGQKGTTEADKTLSPKLSLDVFTKEIAVDKTECQGVIYGVIEEDTSAKVVGDYEGFTSLTATVAQ